MKPLFLRLTLTITAVLPIYFGFRAGCAAFDDSLCANAILHSVRSPDGAFDAVVFDRG